MSNILITGAAGFIGSQLAYYLWSHGDKVTLLDNFSYGFDDNLIFDRHDFRQEIVHGDIRNRELLDYLFKNDEYDYIYHIAGITPLPDCQTNPSLAVEVNVKGTVNILEAARVYGVKKVIFASTSAVYENNKDFPSIENHVESPTLVYPSTKYTAEQFCRVYADCYGMNITCMRFANVYGPHLDCLRTQPPVVGYMIRELYYNRPVELHSNGEQKRDFVYVEDLVKLLKLVQNGVGYDVVNVSTETTVSINELYKVVAELMGKRDALPVYFEAEHFWHNYPNLYNGAYRISEEVLAHEVCKYTLLSNKHARDAYGWKPKVSLRQGVQNTIDFTIKVLHERGGNHEVY